MDIVSSQRVFLFPSLGYGHISPFVELAKKLSERGFYIYLCSTPINLKSIQHRISNVKSIQLVEFHLPTLPQLPPQNHTLNGLPLHLKPILKKAIKMAIPSLSKTLKALNPDLIIHDPLAPWVPSVAAQHSIPAVRFFPGSAAMASYFYHLSVSRGIEFPFPGFRLGKSDQANLYKFMGDMIGELIDSEDEIPPQGIMSSIGLIKTSREIEGKYIDYLSDVMKIKIIPVGHQVQEPVRDGQGGKYIELIEWLGKKVENSCVFISFGTEVILEKEAIEEIAFGLELSQVNFIWVIRFLGGVEKALPEGFLERIGDKGRVVEGWAPQADILSHPSTGGFVSHCGWNSTLESLEFGIPLIAMPIQFDQPFNAKLSMEIGVGVEVMKDDNGKFHREEIAKVIKDVLVGNTAERMRKKVRDTREKVKTREKEEMDEVCKSLARICQKSTTGNGNHEVCSSNGK